MYDSVEDRGTWDGKGLKNLRFWWELRLAQERLVTLIWNNQYYGVSK